MTIIYYSWRKRRSNKSSQYYNYIITTLWFVSTRVFLPLFKICQTLPSFNCQKRRKLKLQMILDQK